MDFGFSDEQDLLREEVRKLLDERCGLERVRELSRAPEAFDRGLWDEIAELGWCGLIVPEADGGAGLTWVDLIVVLEETGRGLFPLPLASSTLAAAALVEAGDASQRARWLGDLASGRRIGVPALHDDATRLGPEGVTLRASADGEGLRLEGRRTLVADVGAADLWVVACRTGDAPDALALVVLERDDPGVSAQSVVPIDATRRTGTLELDGVRVGPERLLGTPGAAWPAIERLADQGAVATAAEMVGAAEQALRITTEYARERVQFGSPIGRYQGVKHPLAEMYVDVESFRSLVYYAAWAVDESPGELPRSASLAKAYASEAFARIGIDGVGLHGAVGFTAEYDIQLYLKRAKWSRPLYGDQDAHHERAARLGGL